MNNKYIYENQELFLCPDTKEDLLYVKKDDQRGAFVNKFESKFRAEKGFVDFVGAFSGDRVFKKRGKNEKDEADTIDHFLESKDWYHKMINKAVWGQELNVKSFQNMMRGILMDAQDGYILDAPVSTGLISAQVYKDFPKGNFVACDYEVSLLQKAYGRLSRIDNVMMVQMNPEKMPFKDETFDAVMTMFGLNFYKNYEKVLKEMFRVMKPGGKIIGTCYVTGLRKMSDMAVEKYLQPKNIFHSVFAKTDLEKVFESTGFQNVSISTFGTEPLMKFGGSKPKAK